MGRKKLENTITIRLSEPLMEITKKFLFGIETQRQFIELAIEHEIEYRKVNFKTWIPNEGS